MLKIVADDIIDIKKVRQQLSRHIHIKIPYIQLDKEILSSIRSLADQNKGNCRFILNIESSSGYMQKIVSNDLHVSPSLEFIAQLREILGKENVWIKS